MAHFIANASPTSQGPTQNMLNRPATQHGLSVKQQQLGGATSANSINAGRQVQDRTYWADTIRQKISYLRSECEKLDSERNAGQANSESNADTHTLEQQ